MSSFLDVLKNIAPTIAGVLSGPYAPLVVPFITAALGHDPITATVKTVTDALTNSQLTGDQILAIKKAEIDFKQHLSDHDITVDQIMAADTSDARGMQISVRSRVPSVLAMFITAGFFGILAYMLLNPATTQSPPLLIMLGSLGTAWVSIIHFYFGSSHSSQNKDATINNLSAG